MNDDLNQEYTGTDSPFINLLSALILEHDFATEGEDNEEVLSNIFVQARQINVEKEVEVVRYIAEWMRNRWNTTSETWVHEIGEIIEAVYKYVEPNILAKMLIEQDVDLMFTNAVYYNLFTEDDSSPINNLTEDRIKDILTRIPESESGIASVEDLEAMDKDGVKKVLNYVVYKLSKDAADSGDAV